jgi:hypothetical protein
MQRLLNAMKLQAQLAQQGSHARLGKVLGYDPDTYRAKVLIQPENQISGWMPVASEWVGNGWGMFAPPAEGDAVLVEFFHGDFEAGIITRRFYHNAARPVASIPAGEFWLVHQSGSGLKFHNDGNVEISSHKDLTATVGGALNANVTGKATIAANGGIDLIGAQGAAAVGVVQGDCVCAFTGAAHPMVSATIKGSK